jgi:hypothetical protein
MAGPCIGIRGWVGKGTHAGHGETAQWPPGLAWLSICYAKFAECGRDFNVAHQPIRFDWDQRRAYFDKALHYFRALEETMTAAGQVPEMFVGPLPGHNTPLAWAQSFHIIASQMLLQPLSIPFATVQTAPARPVRP